MDTGQKALLKAYIYTLEISTSVDPGDRVPVFFAYNGSLAKLMSDLGRISLTVRVVFHICNTMGGFLGLTSVVSYAIYVYR